MVLIAPSSNLIAEILITMRISNHNKNAKIYRLPTLTNTRRMYITATHTKLHIFYRVSLMINKPKLTDPQRNNITQSKVWITILVKHRN
jgi:hypothetical protein